MTRTRISPSPLPGSNLLWAALLWASASGVAGCVFTPRYVLLKEFAPNVEEGAAPGLAGRRVLVRVSDQRVDINTKWAGTVPLDESAQPPVREMERWETEQWDAERDALERSTTEDQRSVVGWLRNGFGMHTANVEAVNPPAEWLHQSTSMELHHQGAVLVGPAEIATADLIIDITLRYMKVDIYMANWADLVVDVRVWPRGGAPVARTIHTTGSQAAWTGSGYEYYRCFRRCGQRLMRELVADAQRVLKAMPPPGAPQS